MAYGHPPSCSCRGLGNPLGPQTHMDPTEGAFDPLSHFPLGLLGESYKMKIIISYQASWCSNWDTLNSKIHPLFAFYSSFYKSLTNLPNTLVKQWPTDPHTSRQTHLSWLINFEGPSMCNDNLKDNKEKICFLQNTQIEIVTHCPYSIFCGSC